MELALDIVIIILITVMIAYSVILNIKLKTFRNAQNEMAALVAQLNDAVSKAQASVAALKNAALTEEKRLESLVIKSRLLADELEIITESGSNLADRIERGLVPSRKRGVHEDYLEETSGNDPIFEEDNEMLKALNKVR